MTVSTALSLRHTTYDRRTIGVLLIVLHGCCVLKPPRQPAPEGILSVFIDHPGALPIECGLEWRLWRVGHTCGEGHNR